MVKEKEIQAQKVPKTFHNHKKTLKKQRKHKKLFILKKRLSVLKTRHPSKKKVPETKTLLISTHPSLEIKPKTTLKKHHHPKGEEGPTEIKRKEAPNLPEEYDLKIFQHYLQERLNFFSSQVTKGIHNLQIKENQEFMENEEKSTEFSNENPNYDPLDRVSILFELKKLFYNGEIKNKRKPKNFLFSIIALGDKYLKQKKTDRKLSKEELKLIYLASTSNVAKDFGVHPLNKSEYLEKFVNKESLYKLEIEMIKTVDLLLYPVKPYDYFERIFVYLYQTFISSSDNETQILIKWFLEKLQEEFEEIYFLLLLEEESKNLRPSINFLSCLFFAYERIRVYLNIQEEILTLFEQFMMEIQKQLNYPQEIYEKTKKKINHISPVLEECFQNRF